MYSLILMMSVPAMSPTYAGQYTAFQAGPVRPPQVMVAPAPIAPLAAPMPQSAGCSGSYAFAAQASSYGAGCGGSTSFGLRGRVREGGGLIRGTFRFFSRSRGCGG